MALGGKGITGNYYKAALPAFYPGADPVNIGHDKEITIRDLYLKLCDSLGRHPEFFFDTSMPEGYPRRAADTTKLKEATYGWESEISLEAGLAEMIELYLARVGVD